ncbi:DUF2306 domain-containing protein [Salinispora arenicola]|uniref:DUF2306 domain-containing protein n=1 Tax=Salinispora arenicola TaxID=168697 RepID=UPI0016A7AAEC|nr:DUF2306 domain-containing protein [Salinispora arenicola]NIL64889.1 DUF2306 domain-containing protein [Salinispora arenicola]
MTVANKESDVRPDGGGTRTRARANPPTRRSWLTPTWLGLFGFIVVAWVAAFVLPTYIGLDPAKARVALREDVWFHYPVVIVHVVTSAVALFAGCLQMSSSWRRYYPRAHRISGRMYLFAGVIPGGLSAATLIGINIQGAPADAGLSISVGNSAWALLWVTTGVLGWRYARRRWFADHRRIMIYSFALTVAILWTRPFAVAAFTIPGFRDEWFFENVGWIPWVTNLVIAQWWLNRTARRPIGGAGRVPVTARGDC